MSALGRGYRLRISTALAVGRRFSTGEVCWGAGLPGLGCQAGVRAWQ